MNPVTLSPRALQRRGHTLRRLALGATIGLLALAVAAPAQAAPPVRARALDGTLLVSGTPFADTIVLRLAAGNAAVGEIDVNADGSADLSFTDADFSRIVLDGAGGADTLTVDTGNGAFPADQEIVVNGGAGDDALFGGLGHQVLLGASGDDTIDGNQGADDQFGGIGDDVIVWDPGDGSDLVEGGPGVDAMRFFGNGNAENFRAFQNGARVTFTRNLGNIVMDLNDTERIDLRAQGGADDLTVEDIAGTDLRQIDADLVSDGVGDHVTVKGGPADDTFRLAAAGSVTISRAGAPTTRIAGADALLDSLVVNGLGGSDSFEVGQGVTGLIQLQTID